MAESERKMTKREARKWVRRHWATYMDSADCPGLDGLSKQDEDVVADIFVDESQRLARRLGLYRDFKRLEPPHG